MKYKFYDFSTKDIKSNDKNEIFKSTRIKTILIKNILIDEYKQILTKILFFINYLNRKFYFFIQNNRKRVFLLMIEINSHPNEFIKKYTFLLSLMH